LGGTISPPDTTPNVNTKVGTLVADYAAGTAEKSIVDGIYTNLAGFQSVPAFVTYLQTLAQNTLVDMANVDTPLQQKTVNAALALLISQMLANSNTVTGTTLSVGAQTNGTPTPTGNPIFVISTVRGDGNKTEYAVTTDTMTFRTTADNQTGGATANQETIGITGQNSASSTLAYNWPLGSGASATISLIDANVNNSSGNLLQNSDFETWTNGASSTPDNWINLVGGLGSNILRSSTSYTNSYSLELLSDGSTLTSIAQTFNTAASTTQGAGGTPAKLLPDVPYAVNFWAKLSNSSPASGVMKVELIDGTNTVINDDQGTANASTITLTGVGDTSWDNYNAVFRLPKSLPTTVKLRIRMTTSLPNSQFILIDRLAMSGTSNSGGMTQFYPGGPFVAGFSGSTKTLLNDSWTITVTPTVGKFQRAFQRFFNMAQNGLFVPSAVSGTISDGLVV